MKVNNLETALTNKCNEVESLKNNINQKSNEVTTIKNNVNPPSTDTMLNQIANLEVEMGNWEHFLTIDVEGVIHTFTQTQLKELYIKKERYKADFSKAKQDATNMRQLLKTKPNTSNNNNTSILHTLIERGTGRVNRVLVQNNEVESTQNVCSVDTQETTCQHIIIKHADTIEAKCSRVGFAKCTK